jgi:hypothetical protein
MANVGCRDTDTARALRLVQQRWRLLKADQDLDTQAQSRLQAQLSKEAAAARARNKQLQALVAQEAAGRGAVVSAAVADAQVGRPWQLPVIATRRSRRSCAEHVRVPPTPAAHFAADRAAGCLHGTGRAQLRRLVLTSRCGAAGQPPSDSSSCSASSRGSSSGSA